jgi:hypothetical protein
MASLPPPDDNTGSNNANLDDKNTLTTNAILEMLKQSNIGGAGDEDDKKHAFWDTQVS